MRLIKGFSQFIAESDGFGTAPFLLVKEKGIYNYFFYLDTEEESTQKAFRLVIGKYSDHQVIPGAKNSYCVLGINEISSEILEDISVRKKDLPPMNSEKFKLSQNITSRLFETVSKCILDYLESNPKVATIYDEMQDNFKYTGEGEYIEFIKSIIISYLGEDWNVQDTGEHNTIIINR
jgi:hypothetical protein